MFTVPGYVTTTIWLEQLPPTKDFTTNLITITTSGEEFFTSKDFTESGTTEELSTQDKELLGYAPEITDSDITLTDAWVTSDVCTGNAFSAEDHAVDCAGACTTGTLT